MKNVTLLNLNTEKSNKILSVYDKSIAEITSVRYERISNSWLVDLSAVFGQRYLSELGFYDPTIISSHQINKINHLFNAVHRFRGIGEDFYYTVDRVTSPQWRVSDAELDEIYNDLQGYI